MLVGHLAQGHPAPQAGEPGCQDHLLILLRVRRILGWLLHQKKAPGQKRAVAWTRQKEEGEFDKP